MTITECIARLQFLLAKHGDIECESDCPFCGRSFIVGAVVIAPETARLRKHEEAP
jgi:hypothetical protein